MRLTILLIFIASICQAQVPGNFKQVRLLNNVDSVGLGSTTGIVRYDPITGKYRFYNALTSSWFSYGVGNFWPLNGNATRTAVTIDGNGTDLSLIDNGVFYAATTSGYEFTMSGTGIVLNGTASNSIELSGNESRVTSGAYTFKSDATDGFVFTGALSYKDTAAQVLVIDDVTKQLKRRHASTFLTPTSISATSPITYNSGTGVISTSIPTSTLVGRSSLGTGVMQNISVGNGITMGATMRWGGTLTQSTTINGGGNSLGFNSIGDFTIGTNTTLNLSAGTTALISTTAGNLDLTTTGGGVRVNTLTSDRITFAGALGLLSDDAGLTFTSANGLRVQGDNDAVALLVEDDAGNDIIKAEESVGGTTVTINQTATGNTNIYGAFTFLWDATGNDFISIGPTDIDLHNAGTDNIKLRPGSGGVQIEGVANNNALTKIAGINSSTNEVEYRDVSSIGITNSGAANEIVKSNGTNIVGTGLFSAGTGSFSLTGNYAWTGSGDVTWNIANPYGIHVTDANNSSVNSALKISHLTSGSPAIGIGTAIELISETTVGGFVGGKITSVSTTVSSGNETFDLVLNTGRNGATVPVLTFYGASMGMVQNSVNGTIGYDAGGISVSESTGQSFYAFNLTNGGSATNDGQDFIVSPGDGITNGQGGDITFNVGLGAGTGRDGYIIMPTIPTADPCATAPSGTIWDNSGTLSRCP